MTIELARATTMAMLAARAPEATVCPSEVARAITVDAADSVTWRGAMPIVHAAVDSLLTDGRVRLSWKGHPLVTRVGAYRIGSSHPADEP